MQFQMQEKMGENHMATKDFPIMVVVVLASLPCLLVPQDNWVATVWKQVVV